MKKTDSEIQQAVLQQLRWDTRVEETDVGVEVDAGVVTLTGTVSSWAKKVAAKEAAHRVACVLDVADDVKVKIPGSLVQTDTDIAHAVRQALKWDVFVPESQISCTVSEGRVTLEGEVSYWSQRQDAEKAIRNLASVRGIYNKIDIIPKQLTSNEVRKAIEDTLRRQAEHEAQEIRLDSQVEDVLKRWAEREAEEIHLDVREDGRVRLSGFVHSWAKKQSVVGAVKGTSGVSSVDDHLRIEPKGYARLGP